MDSGVVTRSNGGWGGRGESGDSESSVAARENFKVGIGAGPATGGGKWGNKMLTGGR